MNKLLGTVLSLVSSALFSGFANAQSCPNTIVDNGTFTDGLVPGCCVQSWSPLTHTPQFVTDTCSPSNTSSASGAVQMWGNSAVGESIVQVLPGPGIQAGKSYRVRVCYRWHDNDPILPQYVRFRLSVSPGLPFNYPPIEAAYQTIGLTPNTSSTSWTSYSFPIWTAPSDAQWLMINPENDFAVNDGDFVSWGQIDDVCIEEVDCPLVTNGDFMDGLVPGIIGSGGAIASWFAVTGTPTVAAEGCFGPGSIVMNGALGNDNNMNSAIGQQIPGGGFVAGHTYRVSFCCRRYFTSFGLTQVRFRATASSSAPGGWPPLSNAYHLSGATADIGSTDWMTITLPDWTAPASAPWLVINVENNLPDGPFSYSFGAIDDICVKEVPPPLLKDFCNGDGGNQLGCTNCPCSNNAVPFTLGGCLNANATSAALFPSGVPDVSTPADTLHFDVVGANPSTFAVLLSGANRQTNNVLNPCYWQNPGSGVQSSSLDGLRCIGGDVQRHGSRQTDANGDVGFTTAGWGPPNNPVAGIGVAYGFVAGQTRYFQVFYREQVTLGCQTGQNTTNGIMVTFE